MATAPFCEVAPAPTVGKPVKAIGFQRIPPGTKDLQHVINIVNNNFAKLGPNIQDFITNFNRSGGNWSEASRVTQRVRITNPEDPEQYVDVDQINRLVMQDAITGSTWVWRR